jgi:hypothetical protein
MWRRGLEHRLEAVASVNVSKDSEAAQLVEAVQTLDHALHTIGVRGVRLPNRELAIEALERVLRGQVAQQVTLGGSRVRPHARA